MKITESELKKIVEEETDSVITEIVPALAALGGAALRGGAMAARGLGTAAKAAGKGIGAAARGIGSAARSAGKGVGTAARSAGKSLGTSARSAAKNLKPADIENALSKAVMDLNLDPNQLNNILNKVKTKVKKDTQILQKAQAIQGTDDQQLPPGVGTLAE